MGAAGFSAIWVVSENVHRTRRCHMDKITHLSGYKAGVFVCGDS